MHKLRGLTIEGAEILARSTSFGVGALFGCRPRRLLRSGRRLVRPGLGGTIPTRRNQLRDLCLEPVKLRVQRTQASEVPRAKKLQLQGNRAESFLGSCQLLGK